MAAVPATALTRSYSVDLIFTNKILNMQTSWYLKTSRELEVSSIFLIVNLLLIANKISLGLGFLKMILILFIKLLNNNFNYEPPKRKFYWEVNLLCLYLFCL